MGDDVDGWGEDGARNPSARATDAKERMGMGGGGGEGKDIS